MNKIENNLLRFWAKTSPDKEEPNAFHPLICHLIDVAAVTQKIWDEVLPRATRERTASAFGATNFDNQTLAKVGWLVTFIAGLHDLKCSPPFALRGKNDPNGKESIEKLILKREGKESDYIKKLRRRLQTINFLQIYENTDYHIPGSVPKAICAPHGYVTTIELPEILDKERFGFNKKIAEQIAVLIGGHHGVFPNSEWRKNGKNAVQDNLGNHHWENARIELAHTLANLLQIKPLPPSETSKLDNGTIMILAGLVSVADWIGSDAEFFECAVEDFENITLKQGSLENYLEHAKEKPPKL